MQNYIVFPVLALLILALLFNLSGFSFVGVGQSFKSRFKENLAAARAKRGKD